MPGAFPARAAPLRCRRTALMPLEHAAASRRAAHAATTAPASDTSTVPRTCLSGQAARGDGVTVNAGCATSPLPNTTRRALPVSAESRDERWRGAGSWRVRQLDCSSRRTRQAVRFDAGAAAILGRVRRARSSHRANAVRVGSTATVTRRHESSRCAGRSSTSGGNGRLTPPAIRRRVRSPLGAGLKATPTDADSSSRCLGSPAGVSGRTSRASTTT